MIKAYNENIRKAIESIDSAVLLLKKALEDANDDSCRAMYSMMLQDYKKHFKMLNSEIEKHKDKNKWI